MWMLVAGVALWSIVHLSLSLGRDVRAKLVDSIGEGAFKGVFSLLIVGSLVLIVLGWRGSVPFPVYDPPSWGRAMTLLLTAPAMILFVASNLPTNLRRLVRHPQLGGVALWAVAHLLGNGDRRSVVLFGVFAVWAIAEVLLINRRDGVWQRPAAVPLRRDLLCVGVGLAVFGVAALLHPYYTGMSVLVR